MHFTTLPAHKSDRKTGQRQDRVSMDELLRTHLASDGTVTYSGRAYAAVKLAMGSDAYSDEDRADAAAQIVTDVLADLPDRTRRMPMDRVQTIRATDSAAVLDMLRWIETAERDAPLHDGGAMVPADRVSVTRLYNRACHLRRTIDRQHNRDDIYAAELAARAFDLGIMPSEDPETVGTALGARKVALSMLDAIGCRPLRKGDAPIFTLAYAAARATAGLESDQIARELHLNPAAYRKHLSRAPSRIPAAPLKDRTGDWHGMHRSAWADALLMPEGGSERPRVEGLPDSNGVRSAMGKNGETARFPNVPAERQRIGVAPVEQRATRPTRKPWLGVPVAKRRNADWANGLPARSQSRLAAAATVSRKRVEAKTDMQRLADRASVGIR